ncbi:unnamed protein product [Dibothriocephalus latus]|uniref:Uncharacterized protein n=1 Tax=Dibothriocephalus latus TaxID=60516 RepID=A0A3P6RAD2_DIBLA|nr:unnamed protein product [Dibothriocephalus latus]
MEANTDKVDPEFLSHLPSRVKKLRHGIEIAAVSETECQNILKNFERQLAEISALMYQRLDQFGEVFVAVLAIRFPSCMQGSDSLAWLVIGVWVLVLTVTSPLVQ